jgi:hypothetical protein
LNENLGCWISEKFFFFFPTRHFLPHSFCFLPLFPFVLVFLHSLFLLVFASLPFFFYEFFFWVFARSLFLCFFFLSLFLFVFILHVCVKEEEKLYSSKQECVKLDNVF